MSKVFEQSQKFVSMADHATIWLTMRGSQQQLAFEQFRSKQTNISVYVCAQIFATVFYFIAKFSALVYFPSNLTIGAFSFALFNPILLGWINIILRLLKQYKTKNTTYSSLWFKKLLVYLDSLYVVGTCITLPLLIVVIGHNGCCDSSIPDGEMWGCGYSSPHQMPEDLMMASMTVPLILAVIVKGAKWHAIVFGFLIVCFLNLFTIIEYDLMKSFESFIVYVPLCMLVIYEHHRQSIEVFLLSQNQENLLKENERLADETHANELRHMIGNVAHDLKTPLSAFVSGMDFILSVMGDLKTVASTDTEIGRSLTSILDSIHNMKNVNEFMLMTINRCIDYTKASQGLKLVPRMETINFAEAINLPMRCMKDLQQNNTMTIKLLPFPKDIAASIITDKQWLQENILCLLSNAVKYSNGGVVSITATLTKAVDNAVIKSFPKNSAPVIRIEIEDSGIGISEDMMSNLFNPFKQAQRLAGGTGLGLYSLAKRIEALGGTYGVERRRDGLSGSMFWFSIPYRPDNSMVFSGPTSPAMSRVPSDIKQNSPPDKQANSPLNILIVDDSLSILKMSGMMLRRQGHTISTAENGAIAVDMVTSAAVAGLKPYDVVLMDLQMPVMDGLEATSRIRKAELIAAHAECFIPQQLIIGVSACSDNETMEAAFAAGIDAFIPKPFTMQSFKDTYNGLLLKKNVHKM